MRRVFSRRGAAVVCVLALALFLIRPRVGRLRGTVAAAIAQGVGRHVEIRTIQLRLFPRPGFELYDLVIRDNPQFGVEPLLRAPDVTAWLRVSALLRGRIEISSLSLGDASLNLARNDSGRWNVEDLVERTSHSTLAPTTDREAVTRPSFPYIEATRARVNFKAGAEKTHFALTNAEFALWQESQDAWGMRLKAAPIRTDANLTDTGVINVSGNWRRAPAVRQMPLTFSFEWRQAQAGQLSRLLYGTDKQWRGGVLLTGSLTGTPQNLHLIADGSVADFRHRDVMGGGELRFAAHCAADLNLPARAMLNLDCVAPSGAGFLELKGSASGPKAYYAPFSTYDFWLVGSKVPADDIFQLARHADPNFGSDLAATGELDGSIEIGRANATSPLRLRGGGAAHELQLASAAANAVVLIGTLPFALVPAKTVVIAHVAARRGAEPESIRYDQAQILLGPVNVLIGKNGTLRTTATVSTTGYTATIKGAGEIQRLLEAAHSIGIPAPPMSANGDADLDLTIAKSWAGAPALVLGTSQLHSVKAEVHGLNAPLEITNARLAFSPDSIRVQNLTASAAGLAWKGSLLIPRPCVADCAFEFDLHSPSVSAATLNSLLNPAAAKTPWYRILPFNPAQPNYFLRTRANGKITIGNFLLGETACTNFTADMKLNAGEIVLSNISGEILGGTASGDWKANFSRRIPAVSGSGSLEDVALDQVAQLMHDGWVHGTGTAKYTLSVSGRSWPDLLNSAEMKAEFSISDTTFPHLVLVGASQPLRTSAFAGEITFHDGEFSFRDAKLKAASGVYKVIGTAGWDGTLALKFANEAGIGFNVTGTLTKTRVSPTPTAQAALKP